MKLIFEIILFFALIVFSFPLSAQEESSQIAHFYDHSEEPIPAHQQHDGTFQSSVDFRGNFRLGLEYVKGFNSVGSNLKEVTLYDSLHRPVTRHTFHESGWIRTREWYNYNYSYYPIAVDKIVRERILDTTEMGRLYYRLDITAFYKGEVLLKVDSIESTVPGVCATHPYKTSYSFKRYKSGTYLNAQNAFYMERYYKQKVQGDEVDYIDREYYIADSLSTDYAPLDLFLEKQTEHIHLLSEDSCFAKPKTSTYLPYGDFYEPIWDNAYLPHPSDTSHRNYAPKRVLYDFDWNEKKQIALIYGTFRKIKGIPCPEPVERSKEIEEEEELPEELGTIDCYEIVSSKRRLAYTIEHLFY